MYPQHSFILNFIARTHVVKFLQQNNFDGLDLDWEYPKCWAADCGRGPKSDKAAFASWVRELKLALSPKGLLLSAAVSPNKNVIDLGYDVPSIARDLDWIGVMCYDYHGHWDKRTGHVSPMYSQRKSDYKNTVILDQNHATFQSKEAMSCSMQ